MLSERVREVGAKRVVFDGIDMLLGQLRDPVLIRRELFRLRDWLDQSGLTSVITAKMQQGGPGVAPDYELLQFLADSVVVMQDRVEGGAAFRSLRVSKYRGSAHSSNEFPFTIADSGLEVASGTTMTFAYPTSTERVSSGVAGLDAMLSGGYHRGTAVLVSGAPGTAKTTLAASFAAAACRRGEKTMFVSFDEGTEQMVQNVASVGIRLGRHRRSGLLTLCSMRAHADSPESYVARLRALIREHQPRNVVIDPLSAFARHDRDSMAEQAAFQLLDAGKMAGITVFATALVANAAPLVEDTVSGISTVADTWIHVSYVRQAGERNRALTVIKSRGTSHSNQVRELVLSKEGVTLAEIYLAGGEVLMGTLRWEKEQEDRRAKDLARRASALRKVQAEHALAETSARLAAVVREKAIRQAELERARAEQEAELEIVAADDQELRRRRGAGEASPRSRPGRPAAGRARP
jgi:circadian clock protein KaiC